MSFQGYYINLKTSTERETSLKKHLREINLIDNIQRFEAFEPDKKGDFKGLKRGEYGIWISFMQLLEKISDVNDKRYVLLMEDDFRFNPSQISKLENLLKKKDFDNDIVFLDYLINIPLLEQINLITQKKVDNHNPKEYFFPATNYCACCSAFLIRRSSSKLLSEVLRKIFNNLSSENKLIPIDMVLKIIFKNRILKGKLAIPPLGSPDWDMERDSNIQVGHKDSIRNAMRAYVLFRCAASGTKSIKFCSKEFAKIVNQEIDQNNYDNLNDFYKLVLRNKENIDHNW